MVASKYSIDEENKSIWVYLEHEAGIFENVSLELLGKGRELANQLGWSLTGLLLGREVFELAKSAFTYGADEVWLADHPLLEYFTIDAYAPLAYQALIQGKPSVFLLGATPNGRDLAGRLAVRLRTGLNADCTGLKLSMPDGVLVSEVSGFGGGILALIEMRTNRPQMATVRPGVFAPLEPDYRRQGRIVHIPIDLSPGFIQTRIIERVIGKGVDLTHNPVIVAGGRGMEGNFQILQELAGLLGGEIGATRPPVDDGFIDRERQIGQTGVVCSPKLALCCGISGAFHFLVGIEKATTVIAINSDPEAPIFEASDYCVIGDISQILPHLIETIRETQKDSQALKI